MAKEEDWQKGFEHFGYETLIQEPKPAENPYLAPEIPALLFLVIKRGGEPLAYMEIRDSFYFTPPDVVSETVNRIVREMIDGQVYARCRKCQTYLLVDRHRSTLLTIAVTTDTALPRPGLDSLYDFRDPLKGVESAIINRCPTCDYVLHQSTIKFIEPYVCEKEETDE